MLRGLLSYGAARVLAGASMFAAIILLIRNLDGEAYGVYAQSMVLAQVCGYLGAGWVNLGMVRIVPGKDGEARDALLASVRIVLVAAIAVSALVAAAMMLTHPVRDRGWAAAVVGGMSMAFGLSEYAMAQANVTGGVRQFVWINAVRYLSPLPLLLALVFVHRLSPVSAVIVFAICAFASGISVFARRSSHKGPLKVPGGTVAIARQLAWLGMPALLIYSLWPLTSLINRSFIAYFGTLADLGRFAGVSDMINGPTVLLFQVLNWTWIANITAAVNSGNLAMARAQTSEFLGAVLLLAFPAGVALWFAAPTIVALLTGEPPIGLEVPTIRYVALGSIGSCMCLAGLASLVAHQRLKIAAIFSSGAVLFSVLGAWIAHGALADTAKNFAIAMGIAGVGSIIIGTWSCRVLPNRKMWMASAVSAFSVLILNVLALILGATGEIFTLAGLLAAIAVFGLISVAFDVLGIKIKLIRWLGIDRSKQS
jgi:O-antigen/teichoic acid export membrane protein